MIEPNVNIKKMFRTSARSRKEYLRLDKNDSIELPVAFVKKVLKEVTPELLAMYPEYDVVEKCIAKYHKVQKGNVFLANGSDSAIKSIFEIYNPRNVLLTEPTFAMYKVYCKMYGLSNKSIHYDNIHFPFTNFYNNINNNQIAVVVNPNNPIGSVVNNTQLEKLISKEKDCLLIADEAYHGLYKKTATPLIKKYDNLIVLRTFSKFFGLASLRFGYVIASEDIINNLNKSRPSFDVNSVACLFVEKIINNKELIKKIEKDCRISKDYIQNILSKNGIDFISTETNFILIKCNVKEVMNKLKKKKILVGGNFNYPLQNYIRITVGSIKHMQKFWNEFKRL